MTVYLGCYADEAHPNGLKALELDEATGALRIIREYPVSNAIYQAVSPDGRFLYSCTGEGLASFRIGAGGLERLDSVSIGTCVCHVSVMPYGDRALWADYLGGCAGCVALRDGCFGAVVRHQHEGSGPNLPRQNSAHCHQAVPTPDGRGSCVVDLGLDEIVEYPSGRIFRTLPAGAGPRHLLFHPNGRLAFLVSELGNVVASLGWNADSGFTQLSSAPTAEPQAGPNARLSIAAAIRFSPDMGSVVISNRGENSLVVFDYDETTGMLRFRARTRLSGDWPRDFIFVSPATALVACERSGEVLAMRYDADTGLFRQVSALGGLHRPVALTAV